MKYLLITTIAAVLLAGCGEAQQSTALEALPVEQARDVKLAPDAESPVPPPSTLVEAPPVEPLVEVSQPEQSRVKLESPDISIQDAIIEVDIQAVMHHLAAGIDVNAKDDWGRTPLHRVITKGRKKTAELLIANGADVNAKAKGGGTSLHTAAFVGHKEIAELLIAKGADVNAKIVILGTPLDWAIKYKRNETADLLRKHGGKTGEEL